MVVVVVVLVAQCPIVADLARGFGRMLDFSYIQKTLRPGTACVVVVVVLPMDYSIGKYSVSISWRCEWTHDPT